MLRTSRLKREVFYYRLSASLGIFIGAFKTEGCSKPGYLKKTG